MRVLVVEDHEELAATIAVGLRREGMAVDIVFDGEEALRRSAGDSYDVIVLDRDLPGIHGDDVCRALVARGSRARVLMLTAAHTIEERVDGLGLGADDYLPKPFAFAELVARIRALARRSRAGPAAGARHAATSGWTPGSGSRSRAGRRLELSPKELAVLELLLAADGDVVSAGELLARGWDEDVDPVRQRRQGHDQPAASQARRPAHDRDRARWRLPDRRVSPRLSTRLTAHWLRARLPARTIRLRLTLLYGGLFLVLRRRAARRSPTCSSASSTPAASFISSGRQAVCDNARCRRDRRRDGAEPANVVRQSARTCSRPDPQGSLRPRRSAQSDAALNQLLVDSGIALGDDGRALDRARLADGRPRAAAACAR